MLKQSFKRTRSTFSLRDKQLSSSILFLPKSTSVCHELHSLGERLRSLTQSYGYIVYMTDFESNELFILTKEWRNFYKNRYIWDLDECKTIAGFVARNRVPLIARSREPDLRYSKMQDIPALAPSDIMSIPIHDIHENCYGVLELYRDNYTKYCADELQFCSFLIKWSAEAIYQNERAIFYQRYKTINLKLSLDLQRDCEQDSYDRDYFLKNILQNMRHCLGSQSVTLYLEKNKIMKREISTEDSFQYKHKDLRINKELQICKKAVSMDSGELNIFDVFSDTRFDQEVDLLCGRLMRSVLTSTFPRENDSKGVIQVNNKIESNCFVRIDTFMLKLYKRFLSIWSFTEDVRSQKNFNEILNNEVFLPMLTYQFDRGLYLVQDSSLEDIQILPFFLEIGDETDYTLCPEKLLNLMCYSFLSMCDSMFNESKKVLRNFLYMVRQCYWETPSNRFEYAFESFRVITCVIRSYPTLYNKWERVAVLISGLCLNINSRDFPDSFLIKSRSHIHELQNNHSVRIQNLYITEYLIEKSGVLKNIPKEKQTELNAMIKYLFITTSYRQIPIFNKMLSGIFEDQKVDLKNMKQKEMLTCVLLMGATFTKFYKYNIHWDEVMIRYWNIGEATFKAHDVVSQDHHEIHKDFLEDVILPTMDVLSKYIEHFNYSFSKIKEMFYIGNQ